MYFFPQKIGFDISCNLSASENLHKMSKMFSEKDKKNLISLSAELAQRVVMVKTPFSAHVCPVLANSVDPDQLASDEAN